MRDGRLTNCSSNVDRIAHACADRLATQGPGLRRSAPVVLVDPRFAQVLRLPLHAHQDARAAGGVIEKDGFFES